MLSEDVSHADPREREKLEAREREKLGSSFLKLPPDFGTARTPSTVFINYMHFTCTLLVFMALFSLRSSTRSAPIHIANI